MAAERSDEEHANSMDQHVPDGEGQDGREKGSGRRRSKGKAANHVEPGRGQPEKDVLALCPRYFDDVLQVL